MLSIVRTPVLRTSRIIRILSEYGTLEVNDEGDGEVAATWCLLLKEVNMLSLPYEKEDKKIRNVTTSPTISEQPRPTLR